MTPASGVGIERLGQVWRLALCLIGFWLAPAAHAGVVVPKDANLLVLNEVLVSDITQLAALVGEDSAREIPWEAVVTDTGFTLNTVTSYRDGTLQINYVGSYDALTDVVSWTGVVTFTNAVGSVSWNSSGTYDQASRDGFFKKLARLVKKIAQNATFINILTEGVQAVVTIATSGAALAPAAMVSNVVHSVVEVAQVVNTVVETIQVTKGEDGSVNASATRQESQPPPEFPAEGLIKSRSPYMEVLSRALIAGKYSDPQITVRGRAVVSTTLCLNAPLTVVKDTYVRASPFGAQKNNYGMQEFIAAGGGAEGGQTSVGPLRGFVQFELSTLFQGQRPNTSVLSLTVQGYEGGSAGTRHALTAALVSGGVEWQEGNGFEGAATLRPPDATDPASAFGMAWLGAPDNPEPQALNNQSQPPPELEVTASAVVTQGTAGPGAVVNWDVKAMIECWLANMASPGSCEPNLGIRLSGGTRDSAVRFGAREGLLYKLPGAVRGPMMTLSWFGKGDFNVDGFIDKSDLRLLLDRLGPVGGANTAFDLDENGSVNVLDARKLTRCCSRPNCAVQ